MALDQAQTKEDLAVAFSNIGNWIGVFSGATEATGGTPAYARKQTTWTAGAVDGVVTGSEVEIDLPAGTWDGIGIFAANSGGRLVAKIGMASMTYTAQGKLRVTPTYTQS